jgi:adenylate cyclase
VGAATPALALPDKPSIAVLPFQNMSGDPEQAYFADGMVEEIITALSRIRWLFVIARNSSFTYKGQPVDVKQVARDLGVRYVLEGSVRKGGGRVRITAQLIECATGAHLWADRFDGSLEDVFDLQDQVATSVAGVIEPALQAAESRRAAQRPTRDLTAYDLYLRSLPIFARQTKDDVLEAAALLDRAIALDPHFSSALAELSRCHMRLAIDEWAADPGESERKAVALARRALATADGLSPERDILPQPCDTPKNRRSPGVRPAPATMVRDDRSGLPPSAATAPPRRPAPGAVQASADSPLGRPRCAWEISRQRLA